MLERRDNYSDLYRDFRWQIRSGSTSVLPSATAGPPANLIGPH